MRGTNRKSTQNHADNPETDKLTLINIIKVYG